MITTLGEKLDASQRRDIAQSELLAGFLDKLKATKEADGTSLFDHVALACGSNIRTGHELSNCPKIVTGGGAGLKLGHNIVAPKDTPLCNAWLTMLHGIGVQAERHGDSTGVLKEIVAGCSPLISTPTMDAGYDLRVWLDGDEWFLSPTLH